MIVRLRFGWLRDLRQRRRYWHLRFLLIPRRVRIEGRTGRHLVWGRVAARHSETMGGWLWAAPDHVWLGTRWTKRQMPLASPAAVRIVEHTRCDTGV